MKKITKLLIIILSIFSCFILAQASTTTYQRTESNHYGVKKHWTISDNNINNVKNTPLVNADEKIYDFSDILTETEEQQLYLKMQDFKGKQGKILFT